MVPFNTIDLFSGIGGISYALRDIVNVLLYCDKDPYCIELLKERMRTHHIQKSVIVTDVQNFQDIKDVVGSKRVDLLINSSSCVGFSCMGYKKGLDNVETSLMFNTIETITHFLPTMVFMENVPGITSVNDGKDIEFIESKLHSLGYNVEWNYYSACDVGAWHVRKRWFCLAVLNNVSLPKLPEQHCYTRYELWKHHDIIQHLYPKCKIGNSNDRKRLRVLGNSVVPDCVRFAFYDLYSIHTNIIFSPFPTGIVDNTYKVCINLNPTKFGLLTESKYKRNRTSKLITEKKEMHRYPTPRAKNISSSCILSYRCSKDLGTFLKFDDAVEWEEAFMTNPNFVEILMGFPVNYTSIEK